MLATICDDTWNVLNMQHITKIGKDGNIQTSPVVAITILKDPPTRLKMATTLEKLPTATHDQTKKMLVILDTIMLIMTSL